MIQIKSLEQLKSLEQRKINSFNPLWPDNLAGRVFQKAYKTYQTKISAIGESSV